MSKTLTGKTLDRMIAESTEFVCERWGQGEAFVEFYAPLTRGTDGITWIHPAWARDYPWEEITARATCIWRVSGSLWNPGTLTLVFCRRRAASSKVNPAWRKEAQVARVVGVAA